MTHNPAPPIVNGKGPYLSQGVRARWWTAGHWLSVAQALHNRRASALAYRQQTAHLDELARHPHVLAQATVIELAAIRLFIKATGYEPARGRRGGTSWERVLVVVNNQIANHIYSEHLEAEVRREQAALLEEESHG